MTQFRIPDTPDELLRQGRVHFNRHQGWLGPLVGLFVIALIAVSSFYTVEVDEVGVVRRFGRYARTTEPGLHWRLPFGIERVDRVKVKRVFKEEFGFRTVQPGVKTIYSNRNFDDESLMLTGDLNVLDVTWVVQYRIKDPVKFLFNIRDPIATLRDVSESVMRQEVGDSSVTEALTTRRIDINLAVQKEMQEILDAYDIGVSIETVKLQDVNPPDEVKPSFNEVNEAKQEKEKLINQAWEAYNKAVPRAQGQAQKMISEAEGYAIARVNRAEGDASRFKALLEVYQQAPDVTKKRLYLETMERIWPRIKEAVVLDAAIEGVVPWLPLTATQTKESRP